MPTPCAGRCACAQTATLRLMPPRPMRSPMPQSRHMLWLFRQGLFQTQWAHRAQQAQRRMRQALWRTQTIGRICQMPLWPSRPSPAKCG